jgi:hypothetical protein
VTTRIRFKVTIKLVKPIFLSDSFRCCQRKGAERKRAEEEDAEEARARAAAEAAAALQDLGDETPWLSVADKEKWLREHPYAPVPEK